MVNFTMPEREKYNSLHFSPYRFSDRVIDFDHLVSASSSLDLSLSSSPVGIGGQPPRDPWSSCQATYPDDDGDEDWPDDDDEESDEEEAYDFDDVVSAVADAVMDRLNEDLPGVRAIRAESKAAKEEIDSIAEHGRRRAAEVDSDTVSGFRRSVFR